MPNGTYGGVRGRKTKVGGKLLLRFPPTRFLDKDTGGAPFFINAIVVSVYNHKTYLKSEVFRGIPLKTSD